MKIDVLLGFELEFRCCSIDISLSYIKIDFMIAEADSTKASKLYGCLGICFRIPHLDFQQDSWQARRFDGYFE
jgi:hypothetical protein